MGLWECALAHLWRSEDNSFQLHIDSKDQTLVPYFSPLCLIFKAECFPSFLSFILGGKELLWNDTLCLSLLTGHLGGSCALTLVWLFSRNKISSESGALSQSVNHINY